MRNKMNQVKIGVEAPSTVHAFQLESGFEALRQTGDKIPRYNSIQFLESGCNKWILDSRQWRRRSEVDSNAEVGNSTEQHHGLDKQ
jgi:hypothetical protein